MYKTASRKQCNGMTQALRYQVVGHHKRLQARLAKARQWARKNAPHLLTPRFKPTRSTI